MSPNIDLHPEHPGRFKHQETRLITDPPVTLVYDFIVRYKLSHDGNSPTIREIGKACDISSTSVVTYWLKRLENKGFIRRPEPPIGTRYAARIEVVGGHWNKEET